jgi:hypothetical protein
LPLEITCADFAALIRACSSFVLPRNFQIVSGGLLGLLNEAVHQTDTTVVDEKHRAVRQWSRIL